MKKKKFKKYLNFFGPNFDRWPDHIKTEAEKACRENEEFQQLLEEEKEFESFLHSRSSEPPRVDLAQKILAAAKTIPQTEIVEKQKYTTSQWFRELLKPKPAFALALLLIIGFIIGFWTMEKTEISTQGTDLASLLYNEEEILWENSK